MIDFPGYVEYWYAYKRDHPEQRNGQAAFNAARFYSNETSIMAERIAGTSFDPFHIQHQLESFLTYMRASLDAYQEDNEV